MKQNQIEELVRADIAEGFKTFCEEVDRAIFESGGWPIDKNGQPIVITIGLVDRCKSRLDHEVP